MICCTQSKLETPAPPYKSYVRSINLQAPKDALKKILMICLYIIYWLIKTIFRAKWLNLHRDESLCRAEGVLVTPNLVCCTVWNTPRMAWHPFLGVIYFSPLLRIQHWLPVCTLSRLLKPTSFLLFKPLCKFPLFFCALRTSLSLIVFHSSTPMLL